MAHMPSRERRKQLIEAASRVISQKGVAGATTRAIAAEAGTSQASLHYAFDGKDDLFAQLLEWSINFEEDLICENEVPVGVGVAAAAVKLLQAWRDVDRPLVFAQFELILWGMRSTPDQGGVSHRYNSLINQVAAFLAKSAKPSEAGKNFRKLAVRVVMIADGMQFGMLCLGSEYITESELKSIVDMLVQ